MIGRPDFSYHWVGPRERGTNDPELSVRITTGMISGGATMNRTVLGRFIDIDNSDLGTGDQLSPVVPSNRFR